MQMEEIEDLVLTPRLRRASSAAAKIARDRHHMFLGTEQHRYPLPVPPWSQDEKSLFSLSGDEYLSYKTRRKGQTSTSCRSA